MLKESSMQIKKECVKKLQEDFAKIEKNKDNESLNQTLQINIDNVFTLPFAFEKKRLKIYMSDGKSLINSVNVPQLEFQNDIY